MVLSSRVLHFARDQLYWHCRRGIYAEDGGVTKQQGLRFNSNSLVVPDIDIGREIWWTWVRDYSKRKLSNPSDKLAALAGLTNIFQRSIPSPMEPIVGLWSHDLHLDLLWYPETPKSSTTLNHVPSWSWFSMASKIKPCFFPSFLPEDQRPNFDRRLARIVNTDIQWSGQPLTQVF